MVALSYMQTYIDNTVEIVKKTDDDNGQKEDQEVALQQFCLIECDYYIYKCISTIYDMSFFIKDIVGVNLQEILIEKS